MDGRADFVARLAPQAQRLEVVVLGVLQPAEGGVGHRQIVKRLGGVVRVADLAADQRATLVGQPLAPGHGLQDVELGLGHLHGIGAGREDQFEHRPPPAPRSCG